MGGRLIALTAVIGSGKTILSRRLRADLKREGRVIVSRSLSIDKAKISLPLLEAALFYDLTPEKTVKISSQSERRVRDLQELFRRAKKPVALFVDDAHNLHPKTLTALKRLIEPVAEGGGQLSIVLVGHPLNPAQHRVLRLTHFASERLISRLSQRACAQSQTACVGRAR
jgi:type II secretory pathway predicted ATPase ExeA